MSRGNKEGRCAIRSGFTLAEAVLALATNSLVLLLVCSLLQIARIQDQHLRLEKNVEWHLFLNQMEEDVSDKEIVMVAQREVRFQEQGTGAIVSYAFKEAEIVRQVYGQGYVPMLTGIREVWYTGTTEGIQVSAAFSNGQTFQGYVSLMREE